MMKKSLLSLGLILASSLGFSQAFSEDFANGIPNTWTVVDVDGKTPAANIISQFGDIRGWVGFNEMALSTSWYAPPGISSDWLITHQFTVPASNPALLWKAFAPDQSYADGYQVLVSTTTNEVSAFQDVIYSTTGEVGELTPRSVNLEAYAGQTVYLAFHNNSNDKFLLYLDDIEVISIPNNDITVTGINMDEYSTDPNPMASIAVRNNGFLTISDYELTLKVNGVTVATETPQSSVNIPSLTDGTIQLQTAIPTPAFGPYTVEVEITSINGVADENTADNISSTLFHYIDGANLPQRKVVLEEGTGTWCGWCPRGTVAMEYMAENFPNTAIPIAIHNEDPMTVSEYDSYFGQFISGYPGGGVDRIAFPDPSQFPQAYAARIQEITPVAVDLELSYNEQTRELTMSADVSSLAALEGAYGVSFIVIEDGLRGSTSQWAQANYYSGGGNGALEGAGIDWAAAPDPVPASDMVYDHVAVAVVGTPMGVTTAIADPMEISTSYTHTATYSIPTSSRPDRTHIAALVVNNATHEIMNADSEPVPVTSGLAEVQLGAISNYPNPADGVVNFTFEKELSNTVVKVSNNLGQIFLTEGVSGSTHTITTSELPAGMYTATFEGENATQSLRFVVKH